MRRETQGSTPEVKMGFQAANEVEKFSIEPERVLPPVPAAFQQGSAAQTLPSFTAVATPGQHSHFISHIALNYAQD